VHVPTTPKGISRALLKHTFILDRILNAMPLLFPTRAKKKDLWSIKEKKAHNSNLTSMDHFCLKKPQSTTNRVDRS
jgi:hypothetical protein